MSSVGSAGDEAMEEEEVRLCNWFGSSRQRFHDVVNQLCPRLTNTDPLFAAGSSAGASAAAPSDSTQPQASSSGDGDDRVSVGPPAVAANVDNGGGTGVADHGFVRLFPACCRFFFDFLFFVLHVSCALCVGCVFVACLSQ